MPAYIFLCDFATEAECLERKLFGTNPGEMHQHHYRKVAVGDTLFLYNFETGQLRGPYTATTTCQMNIEPTAWKKSRRSFPWQVRVDDSGASKVSLGADEIRKHLTLTTTKIGLLPPAELTDDQAKLVLDTLRAKCQ
jgi:hypothetical protein